MTSAQTQPATFAPYAHQVKTAQLLDRVPRILLRHEVGVGKTISTLLHCAGMPLKTLVLAPRTVMHAAWVRDAQHFPTVPVTVYHGSKRAKLLKDIAGNPTAFVVTTHETFRRDADKLAACGFKRFVIDESSKIKNRESSIAESAMWFSKQVDRVVLLTGTPAPNTPAEYWPQLACIDPRTLGMYWNMIREYFVPQRKTIFRNGRRIEVIARLDQTEQQRKRFTEKIAPHIDSLTKAECLTLPPVTDVVRLVELSDGELSAYEAADKDLKLTVGRDDSPIKAEALLGKLRQITGGAVYSGTFGSPMVSNIGTSKLDELECVLDEIGPTEPVVIWAQYRHEIDRIAQKFGCAIIDGRTKNAAEIVATFQQGGIARLVCHPAACGHGITLTRASYAVFYSLDFSAELFEQARGRLDRAGQTRPITNIMLIAHDTIDSVVYRALKAKKKVSEEVMQSIIKHQTA